LIRGTRKATLFMILFVALLGTFAGVAAFTSPPAWDGQDEINVLTDTVNDLTIIVNNLDAELTATEIELETAEAEVVRVQAGYDELWYLAFNEDGIGFPGAFIQLETAWDEIEGLEGDINGLEATISTLTSTLATRTSELATANAELTAEQTETARLENELSLANQAAETAITTMCASLANLPTEYMIDFANDCAGEPEFTEVTVTNTAELLAAISGTDLVINLDAATYTLAGQLTINRPVVLQGEAGVIIDTPLNGYSISISSDNVIINDIEVLNGGQYGIKVSGANNVQMTNVTVTGTTAASWTGFDFNNTYDITLTNIVATGSVKFGIAFTSSSNIVIDGMESNGNSWGDLNLSAWTTYGNGLVDNVVITNVIGDTYIQFETNTGDIADVSNVSLPVEFVTIGLVDKDAGEFAEGFLNFTP